MLLVYIVSGDEVETVEVKEGATVTLRTDWPSERDADIVWMFGTTNTGIALKDSSGSSTHYDERFRDRLQLDTKTGSLTISNISTTHSGDYKVQIFLYMVIFNKQFNVTVYAIRQSSLFTGRSTSRPSPMKESTLDLCTVLCSVTNGPKVNLSWVRNRDTLKQSSNPDLSVPLCLHLEIHLQENHIYSCVAANPVSNHSTQLNIMQFCPQTGKTISLYKLSPKEVETFCLACNTKIYLIVLPYDLYCFLKIYDYSTCDA
uniref:Ig-like domain-containing protein n=1 Tax=Pygocentrus nattereri TaxID=42514 RepID=A0AAR2LSE4_PYGNA